MTQKNKQPEHGSGIGSSWTNDISICYLKPGERLREGMICPRCQAAKMAYNGMLNLVCPNCGLTETGACT